MKCGKCGGLVLQDGWGDLHCTACGKDYTYQAREPTDVDKREIRYLRK